MEEVEGVEENEIKTKRNVIPGLGQYAVTGGPGRPPGCKNKLTLLKESLLKVATQEKAYEIYREMFKGDKRDKLEALKILVSMFPKESAVDMRIDDGSPKVVIVVSKPEDKPIDVQATDSK